MYSAMKHNVTTTVTMMMAFLLKELQDKGEEEAAHTSKGSPLLPDHAISSTNTLSSSCFVPLLCYRTFASTCMYK